MIRRSPPRRDDRPRPQRRSPPKPPKKKKPKPVKAIRILIKMREKAKLTAFQFSELSHSDYKYWKKLESGEAENPGRGYLMWAARSLVDYTKLFDESDVDEVLAAAGFPPAPVRKMQISCPHCGRNVM